MNLKIIITFKNTLIILKKKGVEFQILRPAKHKSNLIVVDLIN